MAQNGNAAAARLLAEVTPGIVQRAAAILDEEIAAIALPTRGALPGPPPAEGDSLRVLEASRLVGPGETVKIQARLQNDDDAESDELFLTWTDLVAGASRRIPAARVLVTPASLRLPANGTIEVTVRIDVPSGTLPGTYRGLLHASQIDDLWLVLT